MKRLAYVATGVRIVCAALFFLALQSSAFGKEDPPDPKGYGDTGKLLDDEDSGAGGNDPKDSFRKGESAPDGGRVQPGIATDGLDRLDGIAKSLAAAAEKIDALDGISHSLAAAAEKIDALDGILARVESMLEGARANTDASNVGSEIPAELPSAWLKTIEDAIAGQLKPFAETNGKLSAEMESLRNEGESLRKEIGGLRAEIGSRQTEESDSATPAENKESEPVPRLTLVLALQICVVVMLVALGAVVFSSSRNRECAAAPSGRNGTDAPPDWRSQLDAALAAERAAREDAERARESESEALSQTRAAREAELAAAANARALSDSADAARGESQEIVRAAIAAFSRAGDGRPGEDAWLLALRDIARGLSKMSASRGDSPKDGLALLAQWSRFLQGFSGKVCDFSLTLPGIGANVDTSWMTPAHPGTSKVTRVVTWAVYGKNGVRHNAEVE